MNDIDAIEYRHEIMRDLENKILFEHIISFAQQMRLMREHLAQARKLHYKYQKHSWFLDAVEIYCDTINCLMHALSLVDLKSRGFWAFRKYLTTYAESGPFTSLLAETKKLKTDLSTVKYCVLIKGNGIKVRKSESEIDYSANVEETFQKFKQGAVKNYAVKFLVRPEMNHIEEKVLDFVALLYPDIFLNLDTYCANSGKTTFARAFGQLHYLASIGCLVPGREAKLFLFDKLFTHFEKEENITNLRGKLEDDLVRIYDILNQITSQSIIIMNESFTSTTLQDAIFLSKKVMDKIIELDLLCVCVTFIDELASLSEKTVSMVSTVVPENPASRTYKIVRRPADGLAYAVSIAEKHRLTYDCLKERIKS